VNQGRIVLEYAKMMMGDEVVNRVVTDGHQLRLHRGFWPACTSHCFHRTCTAALRKQLAKSLQHYIFSMRKGATTAQGMLGDKMPHRSDRRRVLQTALNAPSSGSSSTTGLLTVFSYSMPDFTSSYFLSRHGICYSV